MRLNINLAVGEYSIAVLTVQGPSGHPVTFWRGAGLAVTDNAKPYKSNVFSIGQPQKCLSVVHQTMRQIKDVTRQSDQTRSDCGIVNL